MDVIHVVARSVARSRWLGPRLDRLATTVSNLHRGFTFDARENGELALIRACAALLREPGRPFTFIDVGAHAGTWTACVLEQVWQDGIEGHLFEPTPDLHAGLVERFGAIEGLSVHAAALADFSGRHRFSLRGGSGGSNSLYGEEYLTGVESAPATIEVEVTTGDDCIRRTAIDRINLLKIDTEGWDLDVLRGFRETLGQHRIDVIQFEYALPNARTRRIMTDFYALLEPLGYSIGALRPEGVRFAAHTLNANHFHSGPNYVAALPRFLSSLRRFS